MQWASDTRPRIARETKVGSSLRYSMTGGSGLPIVIALARSILRSTHLGNALLGWVGGQTIRLPFVRLDTCRFGRKLDGLTSHLDGERPCGAWSLQPGDRRKWVRFLLGHGWHRSQNGELSEGVVEQTEQALLNLGAILEAAGSSLDHLVKTTIFYAKVEDFATINEVYGRYMPDPPPARSAPANVALPRGLLISIEAIATIEGGI